MDFTFVRSEPSFIHALLSCVPFALAGLSFFCMHVGDGRELWSRSDDMHQHSVQT